MNELKSKLLSLLTHPCIFDQMKSPFWRNSLLLTRYHALLLVALSFILTHVTCMALHHTVVIRCNTSATYRTLYHASGHLVICCECYGFERAIFTLRRFLPCTPSCFFKDFLGPTVQPQSQQGFMVIFETQPQPDYLFK